MGEDLFIKHIGGKNKAGMLFDQRLYFRFVNREGRDQMPDRKIRFCTIFRATFLLIASLFLTGIIHDEKDGFSFDRLFPRGLGVILTSKLLLGQMPELFLPLSLRI